MLCMYVCGRMRDWGGGKGKPISSVAVRNSAVQCGAVWSNTVQCVAVRCSVLHCVTACCSVLQCEVKVGLFPEDVVSIKYTPTATKLQLMRIAATHLICVAGCLREYNSKSNVCMFM